MRVAEALNLRVVPDCLLGLRVNPVVLVGQVSRHQPRVRAQHVAQPLAVDVQASSKLGCRDGFGHPGAARAA